MIDLPVLDRFFLKSLPVGAKETIVQINNGCTDKIVAKQIVVIIGLNNQRGCSRELTSEVETFKEFWVWFVDLVIIPLIKGHFAASNPEVGIRKGPNISAGKIVSLEHVELDFAVGLG